MRALLALLVLLTSVQAVAQVHVRGYTRKDGTYVAPHVRSAPNSSRADNWSSKGNINPYTGEEGRVDPYVTPPRVRSYLPPVLLPQVPFYSPPRSEGHRPTQRQVCYTIYDCAK